MIRLNFSSFETLNYVVTGDVADPFLMNKFRVSMNIMKARTMTKS